MQSLKKVKVVTHFGQMSDHCDRLMVSNDERQHMNPTTAQAYALSHLGFTPVNDKGAAMQCSFSPLETFACADWDSLISHATNYQLCDCHLH